MKSAILLTLAPIPVLLMMISAVSVCVSAKYYDSSMCLCGRIEVYNAKAKNEYRNITVTELVVEAMREYRKALEK
jgi:dTDP-D-glucose 4,6-dehydratase